jgi:hypothetical protein
MNRIAVLVVLLSPSLGCWGYRERGVYVAPRHEERHEDRHDRHEEHHDEHHHDRHDDDHEH